MIKYICLARNQETIYNTVKNKPILFKTNSLSFLITESKHDFRTKNSTISTTVTLTDYILQCFDKKRAHNRSIFRF